uniref:polyprenol phosphomannose-dependent alpha 1,6 mannosyltransferase MptB n=1 Tax=Flavobacterium sp. TaxID=239 RepID=UPI00404A83B3
MSYFLVLVSVFLYSYIAFFLERTQFVNLALSFTILFYCGYKLLQLEKDNFKFLVVVVFLFRLIFLLATPNLSQDFYRFIWDGRMILEGMNPYLHVPNDLMVQENFKLSQADELFLGMGNLSASHYSNYPPINQLIFFITSWFGNQSTLTSVVVMRIFIILSDLGILFFGSRLLSYLKLPKANIFLYLLNPLVILELTGNLHFEGVMSCFLMGSFYFLMKEKWIVAAVLLSLSIATKLLPLLLLPLFFSYFGWKKSFVFYALVIGLNALYFSPFLSEALFENYTKTIGLWFTNFEFNASIYFVVREIGFYFVGYNIIQTTGKIMPFVVFLFILYRTFFTKNATISDLILNALIVLSFYLFLSTTVHPWYVINLILLSVFTKYKFPIVWSLLIILSYFAYSQIDFKEDLFLIFVEYVLVFGFLAFEYFFYQKGNNTIFSLEKKEPTWN